MQTIQIKPCPDCGEKHGWWSGLKFPSMVFYTPNGEVTEQRLFEKKRKHCQRCDRDITDCIEDKND